MSQGDPIPVLVNKERLLSAGQLYIFEVRTAVQCTGNCSPVWMAKDGWLRAAYTHIHDDWKDRCCPRPAHNNTALTLLINADNGQRWMALVDIGC